MPPSAAQPPPSTHGAPDDGALLAAGPGAVVGSRALRGADGAPPPDEPPESQDPLEPLEPLVPPAALAALGGSAEYAEYAAGMHRPPLSHEEYHALVQERMADLDRLEARGGARLRPDRRTLVALDVDGTILHMDGSISERVMASIARLRAREVPIVVSTGRGIQAALPVVRRIGISQGWVVCANGAITLRMDPRAPGGYEVVDQRSFNPAAAIGALLEAVPEGIVAVEVPGVGFKVSRPFPQGELIEDETVVDLEEMCAAPAARVILRAPGMAVEEFSALVAGSGLHSVEYAVGWTAWLDVAPQGVTKASALDALVGRLGMDAALTLAVGDGSNDVEMIEWAGVGVVMGSAPQWVRDHGDILTEPVWREGCAAVLDALVERVRRT